MNENLDLVVHILYLGGFVGSAVLPFIPLQSRAAWANGVLFTISGLFLIMAVSGLLLHLHYWTPSEYLALVLDRGFSSIGSFLVGCFFVLLVSGEFMGRRTIKDKTVV
ncbi:MAG: hypothetical protein C0404_13810 [Verrucomicrobia bacterium]|nr:hypothetical protein [Verrucomicrobiota bacterium]